MRNRARDNSSSCFFCATSCLVFTCCILVILWSTSSYNEIRSMSQTVASNQGNVTLKEINEKVFKPFGYEIEKANLPIPIVRMLKEPSCEQTFADWSRISKETQPETPPKRVPDGMEMAFLLNNYSAIEYKYSNDRNSPSGQKPTHWDELSDLMNWTPKQVTGLAYGVEGMSIYNAMKHYRDSLNGMNGLIIGSMKPWVEVSALQNGAGRLLTAEYNPLNIQQDFKSRMSSIHPNKLAAKWRDYADSFDFAASFSSIEHSGIGRYGDAIDPIGDLREMRKIRCLLKPGGLLFFGAPIGVDMIVFNLHRVYGPIRMAMMIQGFELIAAFRESNPEPVDLSDGSQIFTKRQNTLVLRKL